MPRDVQLLLQLYAGLTRLDETGEPYPSLASGWEISDDGLTYRFDDPRRPRVQRRLAAGRRGHPPLVAAAARSGRRRDRARRAERRGGRHRAPGRRRRRRTRSGIEAPDDTTLVVTLRHPASYFLDIVATPATFVVPDNADATPTWQTRRHVRRQRPVRGRRRRRPRPRAARERALRRRPAADRRDPLGGRHRGEHGRARSPTTRSTWPRSPGWDATWIAYDDELGPRLHAAEPLTISYFGFDTTRPPFDDERVRLAFALALDRERLVPLSEGASAQAAASLVPPAIWPDGFAPELGGRPRPGARAARRGRLRRPRRAGRDRRQRQRPLRRSGGRRLARGARRRDQRRDDGVRRLPRAARDAAAAPVHDQLDRRLHLAERDLRAPPRAGRAEQLRRLARRRVRRAARGGGGRTRGRGRRRVRTRSRTTSPTQAPVIPWSYGETWWLVADGLRGLGNLTIGLLDFGRVSWDG